MIALDQGGRSTGWVSEHPVPGTLAPWIASLVSVRYPPGFIAHDWLVVPDASGHVLVGCDAGHGVRARLVGPRSRAVRFCLTRRRWTLCLRLQPGAVSTLARAAGRSATGWTDLAVPLRDFVPTPLRRRLDDVAHPSVTHAALALIRLFDAWRPYLERVDWRLRGLLRFEAESASTPSVSGAAAAMGVSERGLRSVVSRQAGLAPKRLLRIRRLHRAAGSVIGSHRSLSEIAHRVGFTDHAHMVRDFVDLMGETPSLFRARGRPGAESYKPTPSLL